MKTQVLVIHGGNAFETERAYLSYLKNKEVSLERLNFKDWKASLSETLGNEYEVFTPRMPNSENARYSEWKIVFEKIVLLLNEPIILVGHSLGAIFLAKYLSENDCPRKIQATFLVAAPYNTNNEHSLADFILTDNLSKFKNQGGTIFLYYSKDDQVVPFSNLKGYQNDLPSARVQVFENRQHFNQSDFSELVSDIKKLSKD